MQLLQLVILATAIASHDAPHPHHPQPLALREQVHAGHELHHPMSGPLPQFPIKHGQTPVAAVAGPKPGAFVEEDDEEFEEDFEDDEEFDEDFEDFEDDE